MGSYPPQHYTPRGGKLYRNQLPSGSSVAEPVLDDFSSYTSQGEADAVYPTSSTTNFRVDVGNDNIKANFVNNTIDVLYRDLGSVSDSAFVLQFKWNITSYSAYSGGNSAQHGSIALSSSNGNHSQVADGLGIYFNSNGSWTKAGYTDGATWVSPTMTGSSILTPSVSTRWVRMTRESETSFKVQVFTDEFETLLSSSTITIPSSVTGLQYFSILSDNAPVSGTGDLRSTIDDFKFYDGVTSLETDPADGFPYGVDLSSGVGWTQVINTQYDVTNEELVGQVKNTSTNGEGIWKDSGISFSDTEFIFRCKYQIVTHSGNSGNAHTFYFGISDTTGATYPNGARDGFAISMTNYSVSGMLFNFPSNATWDQEDVDFSQISGGQLTPSATTYYLEIIRLSSTSVKFTLYSDSGFSTVVRTHTATIPSTLNGLKYILMQGWRNGSNNTTKVAVSNMQVWNGISSFS
jgi:hypothetical protein